MTNINMSDKQKQAQENAAFQSCQVGKIRTDNSAVIANMQQTINEKDALIEKMRDALTFCYTNLDDYAFEHCEEEVTKAKSAIALSSPVSEKAK